jgi:hypothetical protein
VSARRAAVRIAALVVTLAGCAAHSHSPPRLPDAEGLATPFLARQRVVATTGTDRRAFAAVLQYDGHDLLLLGLTPMGTKAFAVRQHGRVATAESFVDHPLPAPAEAILLDVHWSYFLADDTARRDGWHRRTLDGLRLRERWQGGRIHERIVTPRGGASVHIAYEGARSVGKSVGRFPEVVVVTHDDVGGRQLRLEITTLTHDPIAVTR